MVVSRVLKRYISKIEYKTLSNYLAVTDVRKKHIYINSRIRHFSNIATNIIITHEVAHIIMKTASHDYVWEDIFFMLITKLRKVQKDKEKFDEIYIKLLARFPHKKNGKLVLKTGGVDND